MSVFGKVYPEPETYANRDTVERFDCRGGDINVGKLNQSSRDNRGWVPLSAERNNLALTLENTEHKALNMKGIHGQRNASSMADNHLHLAISDAIVFCARSGNLSK